LTAGEGFPGGFFMGCFFVDTKKIVYL